MGLSEAFQRGGVGGLFQPSGARLLVGGVWMAGLLLCQVVRGRGTKRSGEGGEILFYNGRGTAEQWIKEGKYALNWTRLSCHKFVANQVRLELFVLAYNLGNSIRRLALPEAMKHWSLTSLQTRMIKTGGRLVRHARRLVFQLAEVLVSREMLGGILERIGRLRLVPG